MRPVLLLSLLLCAGCGAHGLRPAEVQAYIPHARPVATHAVTATAPGRAPITYVVRWYEDTALDYNHDTGQWVSSRVLYKATFADDLCTELTWGETEIAGPQFVMDRP